MRRFLNKPNKPAQKAKGGKNERARIILLIPLKPTTCGRRALPFHVAVYIANPLFHITTSPLLILEVCAVFKPPEFNRPDRYWSLYCYLLGKLWGQLPIIPMVSQGSFLLILFATSIFLSSLHSLIVRCGRLVSRNGDVAGGETGSVVFGSSCRSTVSCIEKG